MTGSNELLKLALTIPAGRVGWRSFFSGTVCCLFGSFNLSEKDFASLTFPKYGSSGLLVLD